MTNELAIRAKRGILADGESVSVGGELEELRVTRVSGILDPRHDTNYFWTEEWQQGERQADEDIKAGKVRRFEDPASALEFLREL